MGFSLVTITSPENLRASYNDNLIRYIGSEIRKANDTGRDSVLIHIGNTSKDRLRQALALFEDRGYRVYDETFLIDGYDVKISWHA